jgi:hypothetical protein
MEQHREILDEQNALKQEAGQVRSTGAEELQAPARKVESFENELKTLVERLRAAVEKEEREVERALTDRTATVLTSAIMLGVIIGWTLRKKS